MSKLVACALVFAALILSGCIEAGGSAEDVNIPQVEFECDRYQVPKCSSSDATGKTAYLGLIQSAVDCYTYLEHISSGQFYLFFDAHSTTTVSYTSTYSMGSFTSFKNTANATLLTLPDGMYYACSFIDIDGNEKVDYFEPVASGMVDTSTSTVPYLTDWSQF